MFNKESFPFVFVSKSEIPVCIETIDSLKTNFVGFVLFSVNFFVDEQLTKLKNININKYFILIKSNWLYINKIIKYLIDFS
ncbi:hypothetical protein T190130A13A_10733 [Tenacibaculum sp. 190130A14a]|uniref:Uncharacterized protein n=1 Tax=Tenacibaculum polynesiense TaxID=3137857 RepID=A0ABM9P7F7_9FLAO